jgi:hypothetical protein
MARKENAAKGLGCKWPERTESSERGIRQECKVSLAKERRDMVQAFHIIWNARKK